MEGQLTSTFIKADDPHKRNVNKERITYEFENMKSLEDGMLIRVSATEKKKEVSKELKQILNSRFTGFSSPFFANMNWVDPKKWNGEKAYGNEQITALITHFEVPLEAAGFDSKAIFNEWRYFKNYVRANHIGVKSLQLRKKIFMHKREEYRNLRKLASMVVSLSSSNSSVEQTFIQSAYSYVIKQASTYEPWYITGPKVNKY